MASSRGHDVWTTDNGKDLFTQDQFDKIDLLENVLFLDHDSFPFQPDVLWASPPCTYFSIASLGKHWNVDGTPKSTEADLGIRFVKKTFEIINFLKPKYYFIENPLGKLRKLNFMKSYNRITVTYCQYGDSRMKPTDIWTNSNWQGRPMCNYGESCHESAPRGSRQGTQGLDTSFERSRVPFDLCNEILDFIESDF